MKKQLAFLTLLVTSFFFAQGVSAACTYDPVTYSATCDNSTIPTPSLYQPQTYTGSVLPSSSSVIGNAGQKYPELCAVLNRTIGFGESGQDVRRLQVALGQEGIAYIGTTGYFGPVTQNAVKVFQLRNGIRQTGAVGPLTLARMQALWCSGGVSNNQNGGTRPNDYNVGSNGPVEVSIAPISSTNLSVTLGWNSKNARACMINNENVQVNGTRAFTISSQTNFTINCIGYSGITSTKTIAVRPNQDVSNLPTVNLTINPTAALINTYATLYWTSTNVNYCTLNGQSVNTSGTQQVYVTGNTNMYTISCTGYNGQTVSSSIGSVPTTNTGTNSNSTFTVTPSTVSILSGQPTVFTLSGTQINSCTVNGGIYTNYNLPLVQTQQYPNFNSSANITVYPTYTTNYTFSCIGTNGQSTTQTVVVNVGGTNTGNVTVDITANPANIASGQPVTLNWTSVGVNVNSCIISANGSNLAGNQSSNGSYIVYPTLTTNYIITCSNSNGQTSTDNAYVYVSGTGNGNVTANISASSNNISSGQPVTLSWYSTGATSCTLSGDNLSSQNQNTSGTYLVYPSTSTNFQISCSNSFGQVATNNIYVTVNGVNSGGNVTASITSNFSNVTSGQAVTLNWNSTNASYCTITANGSTLLSNQPASGNYVVYPSQSTNYIVNCYNYAGQNGAGYIYVTVGGTSSNTPSVSVSPTSANVSSGQSTNLVWSVSNANYCILNGGAYNNSYYSGNTLNSTTPVSPTTTTTYTATCYNSNGISTSASSVISVNNSSQNYSVSVTPETATTNSGVTTLLTLTKTNINSNSCSITGGTYNNFSLGSSDTIAVTPTQTTVYTINCTGTNGVNVSDTSTITVNTTSPQLTLNPETTTVIYGESVNIGITKQNISFCTIQGGVYTSAQNIGNTSSILVTPTVTTTYTFVCTGNNNSTVTKNSVITVNTAPTISLASSTGTIVSGNSSTITLTRQNTNACTVTGGGYSNATLSNSTTTLVVNPTTTTTYTFNCTGVVSGSASRSITITVITAPGITVTPYNPTITRGQIVGFTLNKTNVSTCSINGTDIGALTFWNVQPQSSTTYTFTCVNPSVGATVSTSTIVTVQ
jgi:hypothetical protein